MTGSFTRRVPSVGIGHGKRHPKLRTSRSRLQFNLSVMPLDQPSHDVEPKSRALAHRLCRKKRIEDSIADFGRDTRPIIDHADRYLIAFTAGGDFNLATLVDGIQGVIDKVRPDLIELASEPMYGWKILLEIHAHSHGLAFR